MLHASCLRPNLHPRLYLQPIEPYPNKPFVGHLMGVVAYHGSCWMKHVVEEGHSFAVGLYSLYCSGLIVFLLRQFDSVL